MQFIALLIIAAAAVVFTVYTSLLCHRAMRLIHAAEATLRVVNGLAPKVEALIDDARKEIAAVHTMTARAGRVSEQLGALSKMTMSSAEAVLRPIAVFSRTGRVLRTVLAGLFAGNAILRRRRGRTHEVPGLCNPGADRVGWPRSSHG